MKKAIFQKIMGTSAKGKSISLFMFLFLLFAGLQNGIAQKSEVSLVDVPDAKKIVKLEILSLQNDLAQIEASGNQADLNNAILKIEFYNAIYEQFKNGLDVKSAVDQAYVETFDNFSAPVGQVASETLVLQPANQSAYYQDIIALLND